MLNTFCPTRTGVPHLGPKIVTSMGACEAERVIDRPTAEDIRSAVAAAENRVAASSESDSKYITKILTNLNAIAKREVEKGPEQRRLALELLDHLVGPGPDLTTQLRMLDERIKSGEVAANPELGQILMVDVERRLAIAKPEYL